MIKVSLAFTFLVAVLAAAVGVGLYAAGSVLGVVHGVDRLAVRVFNAHSFHLDAAEFVGGAAGLAAAGGVLLTVVLTVSALMYNLISDMAGGLGGRRSGLLPGDRRATGRAADTAAAAR